ncbi:MAG: hypothetical protein Q3979_05275 [Actinomycetaceae bacterium]|nr:hypothetical protein [Actinomycetaceae bacterium]
MLEELLPETHEPHLVRLAVWYHGVVFSTSTATTYMRNGGENEAASAIYAHDDLRRLGVDEESAERVAQLVRAVRSNKDCRPCDTAQFDTIDIDLLALRDAHLGTLAVEPQRYKRYTECVREEYAHIPMLSFLRARKTIIERLLDRPSLFATPLAQQWEEATRENMNAELIRISSKLEKLEEAEAAELTGAETVAASAGASEAEVSDVADAGTGAARTDTGMAGAGAVASEAGHAAGELAESGSGAAEDRSGLGAGAAGVGVQAAAARQAATASDANGPDAAGRAAGAPSAWQDGNGDADGPITTSSKEAAPAGVQQRGEARIAASANDHSPTAAEPAFPDSDSLDRRRTATPFEAEAPAAPGSASEPSDVTAAGATQSARPWQAGPGDGTSSLDEANAAGDVDGVSVGQREHSQDATGGSQAIGSRSPLEGREHGGPTPGAPAPDAAASDAAASGGPTPTGAQHEDEAWFGHADSAESSRHWNRENRQRRRELVSAPASEVQASASSPTTSTLPAITGTIPAVKREAKDALSSMESCGDRFDPGGKIPDDLTPEQIKQRKRDMLAAEARRRIESRLNACRVSRPPIATPAAAVASPATTGATPSTPQTPPSAAVPLSAESRPVFATVPSAQTLSAATPQDPADASERPGQLDSPEHADVPGAEEAPTSGMEREPDL